MKEYGNILGVHYPFARNENFPLDADSLFESYEEALNYARGGVNGSETSYLGQIISVVEEDASGNVNVQVYKVVVETPASEEQEAIWGLSLIGEGGGGGDGKVKDVQFNGLSFLNDETGIANFISDEIGVKDGKIKVLKITNEQIEIS